MFWILIVCTCLVGCGQYGALYLPNSEKAKATKTNTSDNAQKIAAQVDRETPP